MRITVSNALFSAGLTASFIAAAVILWRVFGTLEVFFRKQGIKHSMAVATAVCGTFIFVVAFIVKA